MRAECDPPSDGPRPRRHSSRYRPGHWVRPGHCPAAWPTCVRAPWRVLHTFRLVDDGSIRVEGGVLPTWPRRHPKPIHRPAPNPTASFHRHFADARHRDRPKSRDAPLRVWLDWRRPCATARIRTDCAPWPLRGTEPTRFLPTRRVPATWPLGGVANFPSRWVDLPHWERRATRFRRHRAWLGNYKPHGVAGFLDHSYARLLRGTMGPWLD
mmetsp:Transcript_10110/g.19445  ORF Transcript_10110/g.19445 Transcript_10110/m.19445 type:complete len:211 (+) Transcript_10110:1186-1818(+)